MICIPPSIAEEMFSENAFSRMLYSPHPFSNSGQQQDNDNHSRESKASISELNWGDNNKNVLSNNGKSTVFPPVDICAGTCSVAVYLGLGVDDGMEDIFINNPTLPFNWKYRDSCLLAFSLSKIIVKFSDLLHVESEIGLAKRFGNEREFEFWGALYFRWIKFPWNKFIKTTIAVSTGLNYATGIEVVPHCWTVWQRS